MTDADTEADSGGSLEGDFANPEFIEEAHGKYEEHKREKATELAEAGGTKAWLERKLAENSVTVAIYDREFEFIPMGTDETTEVIERAQGLDDDEDIGDAPALFRDVKQKMADHALDPEADAEFFGKLPTGELQSAFEALGAADMDEDAAERAEQFRDE